MYLRNIKSEDCVTNIQILSNIEKRSSYHHKCKFLIISNALDINIHPLLEFNIVEVQQEKGEQSFLCIHTHRTMK